MTGHGKFASYDGAPFRPKVLMESEPINIKVHVPSNVHKKKTKGGHDDDDDHLTDPLVIAAGHVMLHDEDKDNHDATVSVSSSGLDINERSRHYFCGTDWHDASERCSHPCPGGQESECPAGDKCFADTPCDYHEYHASKRKKKVHSITSGITTPSGSVPSLATLWENGIVTMHSLTAENPDQDAASVNGTATTPKRRKRRDQLELRQIWASAPLNNHSLGTWDRHQLTFVDALEAGNGHGMVLLTAQAMVQRDEGGEDENDDIVEDLIRVPCVVALDARTGEIMVRIPAV